MNKLDTIDFKIFQVVYAILTKFKTTWQNNAIIIRCYDELFFVIRMLNRFNEDKLETPKEIAKSKNKFRKAFIINIYNIKKALSHYYISKNMKVEIALFDYNISKLTRMTDDALYMEAKSILERTVPLIADLLKWNITEEQISQTVIDTEEFLKLTKSLKLAIKAKIVNNAQIKEFIKKGKLIFKIDMDDAVNSYIPDPTDFTATYKKGRKRVLPAGNKGTYKVLISGTVKDVITKLGIEAVMILSGAKKIISYTDKDGNYKSSIFKKDITTISYSKPDEYIDEIVDIPKKYKRSKIKLDVELTPITKKNNQGRQFYVD